MRRRMCCCCCWDERILLTMEGLRCYIQLCSNGRTLDTNVVISLRLDVCQLLFVNCGNIYRVMNVTGCARLMPLTVIHVNAPFLQKVILICITTECKMREILLLGKIQPIYHSAKRSMTDERAQTVVGRYLQLEFSFRQS